MDFYNLLQSAEELLFEIMMWVLLFPRTLWVVLTRPSTLPAYISNELREKDQRRFEDMISPPLCLFIAVALGGLFDSTSQQDLRLLSKLGQWIEGNYSNNLVASAIIFSLPPLAITRVVMGARRAVLQRDTYREPFYFQAYLACPLALLIPAFSAFGKASPIPLLSWGFTALLVALLAWYAIINIRYIRAAVACGWVKSIFLFVAALLLAAVLLVAFLLPLMNMKAMTA